MRANVRKCLPKLREQIEEHGWLTIRGCLEDGNTHGMSPKDRREAIRILEAEQPRKRRSILQMLRGATA